MDNLECDMFLFAGDWPPSDYSIDSWCEFNFEGNPVKRLQWGASTTFEPAEGLLISGRFLESDGP